MAWVQVGTGTSATITAGAGSQTVSMPGTTQPGDLVIVAVAGDISCANSITSSGYTTPENGTGANPGAHFGYKVLTTAETGVNIARDGTILKSCVVQVWRGVDPLAPVDAAWGGAATGTSANPNAGAITVVNADSLVVQVAFLDDDDATVSSAPSTYGNTVSANTGQGSTTVGSTVAIASLVRSAGSEDAGQWTLSSSDAWQANAISFKLQQPFTLAQTNGAATVTGYAPTVIVPVLIAPSAGTASATGYAPTVTEATPSTDYPFTPDPGAATIAGGTVTVGVAHSWFNRNDWAPRLFAGAIGLEQTQGAADLTGYAPTLVEGTGGVDYPFAPDAGTASVEGFAPTIEQSDNRAFSPDAGSATLEGFAPTLIAPYVFIPDAGELAATGYDVTLLEQSGELVYPAPGSLTLDGYAPTWDLAWAQQNGTATISGYAPVAYVDVPVAVPAGSAELTGKEPTISVVQPPITVTPDPGVLGITGQDPQVDTTASVTVTFPFLANAQGFTATPGTGTTMAWTGADGNPLGSLQTRTAGKNVTGTNVWTLTTDFAALGVPANKIVTGIIAKSAQSRCTEYTVGRASSVAAVTLTPTGYAGITIAAARSFSALDGSWQTSTSADTTGLEIPSGSSLTITLGSTLVTGNNNGAAVTLRQDNVTFTVIYTDAKRLDPLVGEATVTGYAPTVETSAPPVQGHSWFPRLTGGANTWEQRFDGGGDAYLVPTVGELALTGYAPSIEFGNPTFTPDPATLGVDGYEPDVTGVPITVAGADYLNSEPATLESASVRVVSQGDKRPAPAASALTLTGYAPTVNVSYGPSPGRGQLALKGYAPAIARDYTIAVPAGSLTATGRVPVASTASVTITPTAAALAATGYAPTILERPVIVPSAAALAITGRAPRVSLNTVHPQTAGSAEITGYAPTLAETTQPPQVAGAAAITGYAPTITAGRLLTVTAALASQPATTTSVEQVRRRGGGALQSGQSLAFTGAGTRTLIGSGDLQSGPASLAGNVTVVAETLFSEPAVLYGRGRIIGYTPPRPRPVRVNRYNVVLKPNKRLRVTRPNQRKPIR